MRNTSHIMNIKVVCRKDARNSQGEVPLIIRFTTTMASAILTEASLSFLGVGVDTDTATWGGILSVAKDFVITHPYQAIYPGLAIVVTVLSISILGDGLRDLLDPKMK